MIWKVPQQTICQWGESQSVIEADAIHSFLIWNVFKGQRGESFRKDFERLSQDHSFVLLQETMMESSTAPAWKADKHLANQLCWNVAQSFEYAHKEAGTGVAIASKYQAQEVSFLRSASREFYWLTPKISLFAIYDFQGQSVLVVSAHVLNFVTTSVFVRALHEIASKISEHTGPVVLAGDFNTWNSTRMVEMKAIFSNIGLSHVEIPQDSRFLQLDHLLLRQFDVCGIAVSHNVKSSDHFPLSARLRLRK